MTQLGAFDSILIAPSAGGTLNSVVVKPSNCNELDDVTSTSGPRVTIVSLIRESGAVEGNFETIVNDGPPAESATTSTAGKSPKQIMQDQLTKLSAFGVIGVVGSMVNRSFDPQSHVGVPEDRLILVNLNTKPKFSFVAPANWTVVVEGAQDLSSRVPAVTDWGVAALIGLLLLAAAWFLRRGVIRST